MRLHHKFFLNAWAQRVNLRQAGWPKRSSLSRGGNAGEGLLQRERVSNHGVSSHDRALDIGTLLKLKPYPSFLSSPRGHTFTLV